MAKQQPSSEVKPTGRLYPAGDDLPEEEGLKEEGFFDVYRPFKEKVLTAIKETAPKNKAAELTVEALDFITPEGPEALIGRLGKMTPELRSIVQKVKFPGATAEEAEKAVGAVKSATKKAFEEMPDDIKKIKRAEALKALGLKVPGEETKKVAAVAKTAKPVEKTAKIEAVKPEKPKDPTLSDDEFDLTPDFFISKAAEGAKKGEKKSNALVELYKRVPVGQDKYGEPEYSAEESEAFIDKEFKDMPEAPDVSAPAPAPAPEKKSYYTPVAGGPEEGSVAADKEHLENLRTATKYADQGGKLQVRLTEKAKALEEAIAKRMEAGE